jgi:hypothetical protein
MPGRQEFDLAREWFMAIERELIGTLRHGGGFDFIELDDGHISPVIDDLPPVNIRISISDTEYDAFEAYPLMDWPPTVVYRFIGRVPRE